MKGFVYLLTNKNNSVLYAGVTSNLKERIERHKHSKHPNSFTAKYKLDKLVYFVKLDSIGEAIKPEKILKEEAGIKNSN
jgi:putative endonuclease